MRPAGAHRPRGVSLYASSLQEARDIPPQWAPEWQSKKVWSSDGLRMYLLRLCRAMLYDGEIKNGCGANPIARGNGGLA